MEVRAPRMNAGFGETVSMTGACHSISRAFQSAHIILYHVVYRAREIRRLEVEEK
jgi:hypothetical protein